MKQPVETSGVINRNQKFTFHGKGRKTGLAPLFTLAIILLALAFQACRTTSSDDHGHPDDLWGVALMGEESELARHFGEEVIYPGELEHIALAAGDTLRISLRFLTEDGDAVVPETDDHQLDWEFPSGSSPDDPVSLVEVSRDESEEWGLLVRGIQPGSVQIRVILLHGIQDPHPDFVSLPFVLKIE